MGARCQRHGAKRIRLGLSGLGLSQKRLRNWDNGFFFHKLWDETLHREHGGAGRERGGFAAQAPPKTCKEHGSMTQRRPFLEIPPWLSASQQSARLFLRAFGESADDLALNFFEGDRPQVITRVLAQCLETQERTLVEESVLWELPIGIRMEALLVIAALSDTRPLYWRVRCHHSDCGSQSELALEIDELIALAADSRQQATTTCSVAGHAMQLRRPTGRDQLHWMLDSAAEPEMYSCMARSILVTPDLDALVEAGVDFPVITDAMDAAMDAFDPLMGFHLGVVCPACSRSSDQAPDLAAAALERLWRVQNALLDEIHVLASRYHWSETEILHMPQWRRQAYLNRLESQEA